MRIENIRSVSLGSSVATSTTAAVAVAKQKNRTCAIVQNADATIVITVGSQAALTAGQGIALAAGATLFYYGQAPLYAQAASGTPSLRVIPVMGVSNNLDTSVHSQVAVGTTRVKLLPKNMKRVWVTLSNTGANPVTVGNVGVTAGVGGVVIPAAGFVTLPGAAELYAIAGVGTNNINIREERF